MADLTRSELDRLGDRLKAAGEAASDRAAYNMFRASFGPSLSAVIEASANVVRQRLHQAARFKTLESTAAKLRRGSSRLSQIQDIAGLRFVVKGTAEQGEAVASLIAAFPNCRVTDYRKAPQNGYRAVHIITPQELGRRVEIQLRTDVENVWANTSELAAAVAGMDVKYGGGPAPIRASLDRLSQLVAAIDGGRAAAQAALQQMHAAATAMTGGGDPTSLQRDASMAVDDWEASSAAMQSEAAELLRMLRGMIGSAT